ncbi:MAG: hypothetical protein ACYCTI_02325 [Acidimicrobiales bacterium]
MGTWRRGRAMGTGTPSTIRLRSVCPAACPTPTELVAEAVAKLAEVAAALEVLRVRPRNGPRLVPQPGDPSRTLDVTDRPEGTEGYDDLFRSVVRVDLLGVDVPVASLADVISSKEVASRAKDISVLPDLIGDGSRDAELRRPKQPESEFWGARRGDRGRSG